VLGTTGELRQILRERKPDELLIAIPSASGDVRERIVETARVANVPVKTLPGLHELIAGDFNLTGQIRSVEVEDLLGREPVESDLDSIAEYVTGEVVLVTGAGGSIGSELCRQLARVSPTRLVIVDNGGRDCSKSSASRRRAWLPRDRRSARRRGNATRCGGSSRSIGLRSSFTPPRTSTSR
jgi:FlaA1/EpsC-like NDP-sugar epimerase